MKLLIFYRPNSEHARISEEFVANFNKLHPTFPPELIDVDSKQGVGMVSLYGIVQYPAVLILADDGQLMKMWQGEQLPLMDEVIAYKNS